MIGKTILVVDDSPTERSLISTSLRQRGYQISTAADGVEAIRKAQGENPDLIVLDIIMPNQNGYQVCRKLKQDAQTKAIPVVMLSSKNQETDRFWGLRQGADAYLTKPFEETKLLDTVASLI